MCVDYACSRERHYVITCMLTRPVVENDVITCVLTSVVENAHDVITCMLTRPAVENAMM